MTITALERAMMNTIRPLQLERRRAATSWNDVAYVNRALGPTLDITFDKLDSYVPVQRWRANQPNLGAAEIVSDTGSVKAYFYGSEYRIPWWEEWLRSNAARQPNAALFGGKLNAERYNMQQALRRLVREIEITIDNDFYSGNSAIQFGGMLSLDGSASTITGDLDTAAGRASFVNTLIALKSEAAGELQAGRVNLAIDHSMLPYLTLPFETATGETSKGPTLDFVRTLVNKIVPVQNSALSKKAFLHWEDPENVEVFDLTPKGVQVVMTEPRRGEDAVAKVFSMWTAKEYRAGTVKVVDGLMP